MSQFNALDFALLVVFAAIALRISNSGQRGVVLLIFSLLFVIVATNEFVALCMFVAVCLTYFAGIAIQKSSGKLSKRILLSIGLVLVWVGAVLSSRYDLLQAAGERAIALYPVLEDIQFRSAIVVWSSRLGTSYVALRLSSFLIESMYREQAIGFTSFLNYVMFFPAYTAGPVERPWKFEESLKEFGEGFPELRRNIDRILSGLVKKYVLADMIQPYAIHSISVGGVDLLWLWLGVIAYSMYIYWDFSGYTDVAIGVAGFLGVRLPENFDRPYLKTNPSEFWNSWHMSFSSWLRDYLFSPLSIALGRKLGGGMSSTIPALILTMTACGLWHGYTVGFAVWGVYHGLGLCCHRIYQLVLSRQLNRDRRNALQNRFEYLFGAWVGTFGFVTLGWVWFAFEPGVAIQVFTRLFGLD